MSKKFEIKKICEFCSNIFVANKTTTRYCSHSCNSKAYKANKRKEKLNNYRTVTPSSNKKTIDIINEKNILTISETAIYLGVSRPTVYNYLKSNELKSVRLGEKTFIRKVDINTLFENFTSYQYRAKPNTEHKPITDFYTVKEIKEKYNIKESWLYKVVRENNIPKTLIRGKSYFSKEHIDSYFDKKGFSTSQHITEWYTVEEIQQKYNLTKAAIYSFAYENKICRKKDGLRILYSKNDFDIAKGYQKPKEAEYYTALEAMEKYNLTRDALYHYVKYHNVPKVKEGRYIKISKPDLDRLFEQPII